MKIITLDFETYYDRAYSLSKLTTEEYIRDEQFEVIGVSVQEDDINIGNRGTLPIPLRYYAAHTGRWGGDDKINMQNLPRGSILKNAMLAPHGYMFLDCDSSQIEARTLAWLAEQDNLVGTFARGEGCVQGYGFLYIR
jgi:hypothetical protein